MINWLLVSRTWFINQGQYNIIKPALVYCWEYLSRHVTENMPEQRSWLLYWGSKANPSIYRQGEAMFPDMVLEDQLARMKSFHHYLVFPTIWHRIELCLLKVRLWPFRARWYMSVLGCSTYLRGTTWSPLLPATHGRSACWHADATRAKYSGIMKHPEEDWCPEKELTCLCWASVILVLTFSIFYFTWSIKQSILTDIIWLVNKYV